jgi:hypothetical protein
MRKAYDDGQPVSPQESPSAAGAGEGRGEGYPSPRPLTLYHRVKTYLPELAYRKACALRVYYRTIGGMFSLVCGRIEFSALDSHCS